MAAPTPPFGPKNTHLHILAGALSFSDPAVVGDVIGAGKVIEGAAKADFEGTNRYGQIVTLGNLGQTANLLTQGYLGIDEPDSVAGPTGRPPMTVTTRLQADATTALDDGDIGKVYSVAVSRAKLNAAGTTYDIQVKAFTAELAGAEEVTPDGSVAQQALTFAVQGIQPKFTM